MSMCSVPSYRLTAGALALLCITISAQADSLPELLVSGTILLDVRDRYEHVQQQGFAKDADAHTIRVRAGYQTGDFHGLKALVELEATEHFSQAFNDGVNGRITFPTVSDPENLELNRLQLAYSGLPDTTVTLGRQLINLDDQRFFGGSSFRQNQQTFDAIRFDYAGVPNLTATYFYSDRVNRVFGEQSAVGHFDGDIHAFNAAYNFAGIGKAIGYVYLLDLRQSPALSTATFGAQFSGSQPLTADLTVRYSAGLAHQTGYANNPLSYSVNYWRGELGLDYQGWSATGGIETLGGTGAIGFSTPLATLHAYQGYADVFLTTPARGVQDGYAKLAYQTTVQPFDTPWKASFAVWYHDFEFARGTGSLGSEVDLETTMKFDDHWRADLAFAAYDGVPGFASRHKIWLAVSYAL